jgi:hypothetical protein
MTFALRGFKVDIDLKANMPYNWAAAVDLSSTDYTIPAKVIVGEMRCKTSGTIKIDVPDATGISVYAADYDIFKNMVTKVYKTGTDAGLATACIVLSGWKID